jgi:putative tricarboxylic transport membrane protein
MKNGQKDIFSGFVLLVFSALMFGVSLNIKKVLMVGIGSGFVPAMVAAFLAATSVCIIVKGYRDSRSGNGVSRGAAEHGKNWLPVVATFCLIAFYIALLEKVGFLLMTTFYLFGQFWVLAGRNHRRAVMFLIVSAVVSLTIYYTFVKAFDLMLPAGILG